MEYSYQTQDIFYLASWQLQLIPDIHEHIEIFSKCVLKNFLQNEPLKKKHDQLHQRGHLVEWE